MELLDDAAQVRKMLVDNRHRRWGFVVYRCTYEDDAAWTRFKELVAERARTSLAGSQAPELLQNLDIRYFDDRTAFEGASKDDARAHFVRWCASDEAKAEQFDPGDPALAVITTMHLSSPRYSYFAHVDTAALESIVGPDVVDEGDYVNIVDSQWYLPGPDDEGESADEGEEPVEGCRMYDVGWMKMSSGSLHLSAYAFLENADLWSSAYTRPPDEIWDR